MSQTPLSPQELAQLAQRAQEQAQVVLKKLPLLGPVAWLLMQQGSTRHIALADLEWRVFPALVLEQAKLYLKNDAPLAFASWGLLSEAAAGRYRQVQQLAPADWKSGDQVWLVDLVAPFGGADQVLKDLRENVFPTSVIRQVSTESSVMEWAPGRTRQ